MFLDLISLGVRNAEDRPDNAIESHEGPTSRDTACGESSQRRLFCMHLSTVAKAEHAVRTRIFQVGNLAQKSTLGCCKSGAECGGLEQGQRSQSRCNLSIMRQRKTDCR